MENGSGFVDGAAVNPLVDGASESKIDGGFPSNVSGVKESEGDEVFEEAVEGSLDDANQPLKEDSNVTVASVSSSVTRGGVSDIPGVDGISAEQHEDEVMEDAMSVPAGFEGYGNEEQSLGGNLSNGASVTTVNDKGGTGNEGVAVDDERGVGDEESAEDPQVAVSSEQEVKFEPEPPSIEQRGTSQLEGRERVNKRPVQLPMAEENLEKGDAEEMGHNGPDAHQLRRACDGSVACQDMDEMNSEVPSESSAGISSGDQNQIGKVIEDGLAGDSKNCGSMYSKAAVPASDVHQQNGVASVDALDDFELHNHANGRLEPIPAPSRPEHNEGGKELENNAYGESTSNEREILPSEAETSNSSDGSKISENKEYETVSPNLEREHVGTNQAQLNHDNVRLSCTSEKEIAKKEATHEGKVSGQASRETEVKPASAAISSSSTEKSSNPVLRPVHPAGLGRAAPLLESAPRVVQQPRSNGAVSQVQSQLVEEVGNGEAEEGDETREKLQMIRVKFLRLAHRLGQTPHNVVVAQVLYRLGLAEQLRGRTGGRAGAFSYDRASAMAEQLEQTQKEPLDFSCTIMVLGKTGVGKSATINSIFDEVKFNTDAFNLGTKKVQDVEGTVQGIKVRVIDTPGLLSSWSEQRKNEKILHSVKQFIKKTPPDIVLYLDRLDMPSRDFGDMPLLRTITDIFGPSIWFNAIVVLTHAASAPPEGPNGTATTYDMFVTQRSHAVQQAIRQATGDMRLMNPVSLVENHSACRTNRAGQRVLPNGQVWKPHLLLLSFASKILAEANALLKLQDTPPGKPFPARSRAPPLPFLLSSLLQSRSQLRLPDEHFGEDDTFDEDLDESSDSDEESEYDELPPFRRLTKAQLAKLAKEQRKAYYDELEYRERLFMKKQLKEEKKRQKMMKKMAEAAKDLPSDVAENVEEESSGAASVPVPMPDLALPASFDADNPTHRYRYLDTSNQWLVRPVLDAHGWDHDVGYEGINVERLFVVKDKIPLSFSGQVSKDKKEANLQMEVASSIKHGEGKATTLGFDMQSVGKDMAYTLRSETRFCNFKHNKATAGLSFTLLGDAMPAGLKVEDKLVVNKQFRLVLSGGAMAGRGDIAYGGSLEATLRDKDYPLGRFFSSLGLSVMDWQGDLAIGCNIQSQIPVGRSTNVVARANLNNRGSGQVSIRLNSSEQIQLALIGLIPLLKKLTGQYSSQQY